jgi:proline iminopeptidase
MPELYPPIEQYADGFLEVGDGQRIYWQQSGNPDGRPAVVLHGGPGSNSTPGLRRSFNPAKYRIIQFDQRGCGQSTPDAADPTTSLETNTTWHLLADIEALREHLGISKWLVFGASWGATLGFLYAEQHPERTTALVLVAVTSGRRREIDWMARGGVADFYPEQWEQFLAVIQPADRVDPLAAYNRMLNDPDAAVRQQAADAWVTWESSYLTLEPEEPFSGAFADPRYRYRFARVVTHYWSHDCWLEDDQIVRDADKLKDIPGAMVHGRLDLGGPLITAWEMHRRWPRAELTVVGTGGHSGGGGMSQALVAAVDRFADG